MYIGLPDNFRSVIVIIFDNQYVILFRNLLNDLYAQVVKIVLQIENHMNVAVNGCNNDIHFFLFHKKTLLLIRFRIQLNLSITFVKLKLQLP